MAMYTQIAAAARAATTAALVGALSAACAPAADIADMWLNPTPKQPRIEASEQAFHNRFMVADLHADTLMWHRGLREYSSWGQVDLNRLKTGNVGLQVFTMVTRAPVPSSGEPCTSDRNFDPTPLLAFASAWPAAAWRSPYQRALVQAQAFRDAVAVKRRSGIELVEIRSLSHLEFWLARRGFLAQASRTRTSLPASLASKARMPSPPTSAASSTRCSASMVCAWSARSTISATPMAS